MILYSNFRVAIETILRIFVKEARQVETEKWQGIKLPQPMMEQLMVSFQVFMPEYIHQLEADVKPNQPWADLHFEERISSKPFNPGNTYKIWPFYKMDKEMRTEGEQFSHTYMERYFPRYAGRVTDERLNDNQALNYEGPYNKGIRYEYGDLDSLVQLLVREPLTRQAYLPVWFPEDTGATHGGRVPCTLGYHFIMRKKELHVIYYIRSCDLIRHFRDDIYLTVKLAHSLLGKLKEGKDNDIWKQVSLGTLTMHITSLHCFQSDMYNLKKKWKE